MFIPKIINVGYQERDDTYSGKLAYVIYTDEKNVLRKEKSWTSWRDKNIEPSVFDNEPISGFVLNKKVGGDSYSWNPRQTYSRIYDPRGFEFEITIQNLLYILEYTNSIKGKGLEGEFVYGWDGAELVLIPIDALEYKEHKAKAAILYDKDFAYFKSKDLKIGHLCKFIDGKSLIYMGKYSKKFTFIEPEVDSATYYWYVYYTKKLVNISKKIIEIEDEIHNDYIRCLDIIESSEQFYPIDAAKTIKHFYSNYELEQLINAKINKSKDFTWYSDIPCIRGQYVRFYFKDMEIYICFGWPSDEMLLQKWIDVYKPYWLEQYLTTGKRRYERDKAYLR